MNQLWSEPLSSGRPCQQKAPCSAAAPQRSSSPKSSAKKSIRTSKQSRQTHLQPLSARGAAVLQLDRVLKQGAYVHISRRYETEDDTGIEGTQALSDDAARAKRSATSMTAGVLKNLRRLDHMLSPFLKSPSRLAPGLLSLLRLAAYELLACEKPGRITNEYVQLARQLSYARAGGLVNAVLRKVVQLQEEGTWQQPLQLDPDQPTAEQLGLHYSHPTWMVSRWLEQFDLPETMELLQSNNRAPEYGIRVGPEYAGGVISLLQQLQSSAAEESDARASHYLPAHFLHVPRGLQQILSLPEFHASHLQVMSESAGLVVMLLDPQPGEHVLDACAAPGSKALFAASLMESQGQIVALDANAARLKLLESAARRRGISGMITTVSCQLQHLQSQHPELIPPGGFDRVLVDAPCSGTGAVAKRADLRWQRLPQDLSDLCALQASLLDAAAGLVRVGGVLVYSTCSIENDENADQVKAFIKRQSGFREVSAKASCVPPPLIAEDGFLKIFQHRHDIEGAFAALLKRDHV